MLKKEDAIKTASKKQFKKRKKKAEATGGLIGNKIADKITSTSKEFHSEFSKNLHPLNILDKTDLPKERHIYLLRKDNKLLMN